MNVAFSSKKSFRVDYTVRSLSTDVNTNNLVPPPNSAFDQLYGKFVNVGPFKHHVFLIDEAISFV